MENKINVVHFIATLKDGGAQSQLILLCNNIDFNRFNVTIVCWDRISSLSIRNEINIYQIQRGKKFNLWALSYSIYKAIKFLNPNIIQLWLPEVITLPAAIIGYINKIPIISGERRVPTNSLGILWIRDRIKYLAHLLSNIIVPNFPIPISRKSLFNTILSYKNYEIIFNGIENSGQLTQDRLNNVSIKNLVYAGRLVKHKNVDTLIRSIKILIDEKYDVNLKIFGTGSEAAELKLLVQDLELENFIQFLGYQDNWREIASAADCFILPTSREGMPNVLFEAIDLGLPVVSTNIEEIAYHFTNQMDAILVEPRQEIALAEAISNLIKNPDLVLTLKQNSIRTLGKYSVQSMANKYQSIYSKLSK